MSPTRTVLLFLVALTVLRWAVTWNVELSPDEAYYSMWADRMDWSFYSKGPGVAATIWAGKQLFGESALGVRFFSPLLAMGTSLIMFWLAGRMFDRETALWTVITANLLPIFSIGALVMTIDPLSIFFWAAGMACFWMAVERAPKWSLWWPLAGLAVGLGFLCKYTNAAFLLSAILFLALGRKSRGEFRRPGVYSMLMVSAVCTLPVFVWNSQNQWITFLHLRSRGGLEGGFGFRPMEFLEFAVLHLGVYSPLIFAGIALAVVWTWRDGGWAHIRTRYLLSFGLPLVAAYTLLSFNRTGEANWTAPAFVALLPLTVAVWLEKCRAGRTWHRPFAFAALALGLGTSLLAPNTDMLRSAGLRWEYEKDPGGRLRAWESTAMALHAFRTGFESMLDEPVFLIADRYQTAATLAFYLPERRPEGPAHPPLYIPESQTIENQFSFWHRYDEFVTKPGAKPQDPFFTEQDGVNPFLNRTAIYVTERDRRGPASAVQRGFDDWELIGEIEIFRYGLVARRLRVFACYNYQTAPL